MANTDYIEVTIKEAAHEDAGRGIARLSIDTMKALDLVSGDVIEIEGRQKAATLIWPGFPQDTGKAVLRIDGSTRSNVGAGIDDKVRIKKTEAGYAKKVTIQPTQPIRLVGGEQYLGRILRGRPVTEGQHIRVSILGNPLTFAIARVVPKGIAIVTDSTEIELKETPYEPEKGRREAVTDVHYEDIGGLDRELQLVREMIELPLRHPELFERLGIEPPKGVLLYGPPGTGKTLIAKAVANEVDAHFVTLSGPEIMSKYYGESEERLREVFEEAQENAPSIIFIDEIDSIAPKREEVKGEVERRVVAQLLALMDGLKTRGQVVVIAATNLPEIIDPALRRGGRFDREIEIGIPDTKGRQQIFQIHTRGMPLAEDVNLDDYARSTHGFVGADIALLAKEAAMHALRRIIPHIKIEEEIPTEIIDQLRVTNEDFLEAHKHVEPSAMREVLVEIPDVKWEDVGGLEDVKAELAEAVEWPLKYPEIFDALETEPPRGILLFGPPGTGKTLLAKAVANESESNFISVKGPELLSKWVGESERGVRQVFRKARQAAPSIIFFDEIDALMPKRGAYIGSSHVTESVVSQILTELDGLEELNNVVVLGATNRPDMLDEALLRPGRLDRMIYVPPPDREGRKKIFEVYLRNREILANDVDIDELVERTEGYVGADIEALVREAKISAMREFIAMTAKKSEEERRQAVGNVMITKKHFEDALSRVRGTLDLDRLEEAERHSWQVLYNQEQRSTLEDAVSTINRARMRETGKIEQEVKDLIQTLKDAVYQRKKDFGEIRRLTKELKTRIERPLPQTGMAF
ncbi:CDC48 family AAA ATPase [Methanoculleus bourgensis]|jgi:transitional endoplasmic reticulum ATPase|uniref:CDC48 family AAA ATPase n=1 Tax=Methanoculleus bourgensis TaxID=83986 RepID=A0A7K4C2I5_9EURY|nr:MULTISPECIES: CDC48 family AAA ATPase [Methanoculleus]MBT0733302.1 CDC48 family AAA ATPase [Methanoculleus bourgensis]MDD3372168.1 CDC48 family AAA ATPase [Methanoculleus bourgensis]NMA88289.1 CDC48 family AAA ATPase [Methanoculleus bourgensis]NQS77797.1 CDC48 family AAA ATPase [Methanoculleus bourgensis]